MRKSAENLTILQSRPSGSSSLSFTRPSHQTFFSSFITHDITLLFFSAVLILSGFLKDLISSLGYHTKPHTTQLSGKRICPPWNYTIPSNIIGMKSYHLSKNLSTKDIHFFRFLSLSFYQIIHSISSTNTRRNGHMIIISKNQNHNLSW